MKHRSDLDRRLKGVFLSLVSFGLIGYWWNLGYLPQTGGGRVTYESDPIEFLVTSAFFLLTGVVGLLTAAGMFRGDIQKSEDKRNKTSSQLPFSGTPAIPRSSLERQLRSFGVKRTIFIIIFGMSALAVSFLSLQLGGLTSVFVVLILSFLIDRFFISRFFKCPSCGENLWEFTNKNFKAAELKLLPDFDSCPSCRVQFENR